MRFPTLVREGKRRPIIAVSISVPGRNAVFFDALVDTGADISVFPKSVADRLGLNLSGLPASAVFAAVGGMCSYQSHVVSLELRRAPEVIRWDAAVGFVDREMAYGILGTKGFFEHFDLTYRAKAQTIDISAASDGEDS